jgi:hypothetical protein
MKSQNHNEGKLRPRLILKDMQRSFLDILKVRENGCKKYSPENWSLSKGTDHHQEFLDENMDSIQRHLLAYMSGDELDDESRCHHLAHAALRCMFALEYSDV